MTKALIIIDWQNDYFPGGKFELVGSTEAAVNSKKVLDVFREKKLPVFVVQHLAPAEFPFLCEGTTGGEVYDLMKPIAGETLIQKRAPNSFFMTSLNDDLKKLGVKELVVVGAMTHLCVDTTVRAAVEYGYTSELLHDCTATRELEFGGIKASAESTKVSYMAALGMGFCKILSADEWIAQANA